MTQHRIGLAIVVASLLAGPATVLAQTPTPEETPPAEGAPAEGAPAEEVPAPEDTPAVVAEPEPVEAVTEEAESASFGYDKGFYIAHDSDKGSFKLKIQARLQSLLVADSTEGTDSRQDKWAFSINRARLTFSGHAFTKKFEYKFQTDFGKGFVTLKDFYIDAALADEVWLRTGQWKRPFSRQQINSSGNLELVDRAITDKQFHAGRDIGVAVHNGYEDSPDLEWAVGVYNGTGEKPSFSGGEVDPTDMTVSGGSFSNVPKDFKPVVVARVGINRGGIKGYSEADLEGGPLRWGVAASGWVEGDVDAGDPPVHQAELDGIVKLNGLSFSAAGYLQTVESELDTIGAHAQVGKVFGKDTMRMNGALRYGVLVPQGDMADDPSHELTIGWGWLPHKHGGKLQVDLSSLIPPGGAFADHLVARVQGQISF